MQKINKEGLTEDEFLKQYEPGNYERPSVTVDMVVYRMKADMSCLQLLLIKRENHPYIDQWALPGGFIEMTESSYEAACRELQEETGLTDVYLEQLYTMSKPERDPRMRVISIAYTALLPYGNAKMIKAGDDAKDAAWFDVSFGNGKLQLKSKEKNTDITYTLKSKSFTNGLISTKNYIPVVKTEDKLAFDHDQIILESLMRLQNKVKYTDIAFNLVPTKFTLPDLQNVYEIILGEKLYKANFREKIKKRTIKTRESDFSITGNSNQKSILYMYKGD